MIGRESRDCAQRHGDPRRRCGDNRHGARMVRLHALRGCFSDCAAEAFLSDDDPDGRPSRLTRNLRRRSRGAAARRNTLRSSRRQARPTQPVAGHRHGYGRVLGPHRAPAHLRPDRRDRAIPARRPANHSGICAWRRVNRRPAHGARTCRARSARILLRTAWRVLPAKPDPGERHVVRPLRRALACRLPVLWLAYSFRVQRRARGGGSLHKAQGQRNAALRGLGEGGDGCRRAARSAMRSGSTGVRSCAGCSSSADRPRSFI